MSFELPCRFDPEWLNSRQWRLTGYSGLELCELGVLRRPKSSQFSGSLIYATPNKEFPPRYRITKLGGTKEKYTIDVSDMMIEVFGRFSNKQLLEYDYLTRIKLLCMEYNKRYFTRDVNKESKLMEGSSSTPVKKRLCAGVNGKTCGKMITDYRCAACWVMVRGGFAEIEEEVTYQVKL